jgi:uncharacterized membrane protein (DUF2068 family)
MLRTIAAFEFIKGLLALTAASGLLLLTPDDVQAAASRVVDHLNLDPAAHFPNLFLTAAGRATPHWMRLVALGAFVYAGFRIAEGFGLWHDKAWAEWLGVVTGLIYVPFEVMAMVRRPGPDPVIALLINVGIVLFLGNRLRRRGKMQVLADSLRRKA